MLRCRLAGRDNVVVVVGTMRKQRSLAAAAAGTFRFLLWGASVLTIVRTPGEWGIDRNRAERYRWAAGDETRIEGVEGDEHRGESITTDSYSTACDCACRSAVLGWRFARDTARRAVSHT